MHNAVGLSGSGVDGLVGRVADTYRMYVITPTLHRSTEHVYLLPLRISGAGSGPLEQSMSD